MSKSAETMGFQTEVQQILHLVVHSLYSNKEIFLRELISNASDALDKLRFLALSDSNLYEQDSDLKIQIAFDEKKKTITIKDNGVGMSRDEAIANLGTIARSGTKEFLKQLGSDSAKDSNLIGQFGVGFYSAFIVADKVTVKTRKAGLPASEGVIWTSKGEGEFSIENANIPERGTEIILHLKKDEEEFLSDWKLRSIISKYSDHICWPIVMKKMATDDEKTEEGVETVNKATALWAMSKSEISEDDYKNFYKHLSHDFQEPLLWSHNQVEGKQEYTTLLYVPKRAPFDMWNQDSKHGLKLYIKRVFVMDEAQAFLPRYLRFIKGIVDAADLPLNVSREILQETKQVEAIRAACVKRCLGMLEKLAADDKPAYQDFWREFGLVLKEGPIEDFANKEQIAKLLRFASTKGNGATQDVSLDDYIGRMVEGQDKIYYITASSYNAAFNSPHLEIFRKKNIEVLLLSDKIDEWLVNYLSEFAGKKLQSIAKGKVELPGENQEEKKAEEAEEKPAELQSVIDHMKRVLGEKVKDITTTERLTDSPACVIVDEHDMGLEMQRILKAAGQEVPEPKPIFELNPEHALIKQLEHVQDDTVFAEWTWLLFEGALLAEGAVLDNPASYVRRVNQLLLKA